MMEGMGRSLALWTPILFVATAVTYLTPLGQPVEVTPATVTVALVAAFAFVVGVWIAPHDASPGLSGTLFGLGRSWTQPERDAKLTQLGVGLLGLLIADAFGAMPGLSAIVGIVVAMLVGAVWPKGDRAGVAGGVRDGGDA